MIMDCPKRRLTGETFALSTAMDERDERLGLAPDLAARLRNVGARVRKHVTEGYATDRFYGASAPTSPTRSAPPPLPLDNDIFCSAKDTLQHVRSAWPSGKYPTRSPRKRGRAESDHDSDLLPKVGHPDLGMDTDSDDEPVTFILGPTAGDRPTKPLRRSRRVFTETRSLPAGALSFSGASSLQSSDPFEDDWSSGKFSQFSAATLG